MTESRTPVSVAKDPEPSASAAPAPAPAPSFEPLLPLDPEQIARGESLLSRFARLDPDGRVRTLSALLGEMEEGRLPVAVTKALSLISSESVPADQRARIAYDLVINVPDMLQAWKHACRGTPYGDGGHVLAKSGSSAEPADRKLRIILLGCELEKRGLYAKAEELSQDHDLLVLAHTIQAYLEQRGGLQPIERQILSYIARGSQKLDKPILQAELERLRASPKTRTLAGERLVAVQKRLSEAIAFLEKEDYQGFATNLLDPQYHAQDGLEIAKSRGNAILAALKAAKSVEPLVEPPDDAVFLLSWRPNTLEVEVRFFERGGVWYYVP